MGRSISESGKLCAQKFCCPEWYICARGFDYLFYKQTFKFTNKWNNDGVQVAGRAGIKLMPASTQINNKITNSKIRMD